MSTPMQYLDKAMVRLKNLGLMPDKTEEAPVVALLRRVSDLDQDKVVAIARTLSQASLFNQVVREQVASMQISDRYTIITNAFNSIRDDARSMVEQLEDGKINTWERLQNVWMKATRGDIPQRFDKIKKTYLEVAKDTNDQIEREHLILSAYQDFRGALKESEVLALQVMKTAQAALEVEQGKLKAAMEAVDEGAGGRPDRARQARACARRAAARGADRRGSLPDLQGHLRQPDRGLQHVRGRDDAARADHEREGPGVQAGHCVLRHQRDSADGAVRVVHGLARPAREHAARSKR